MKIARVFPRITKATPQDELCFFGPPGMFLPQIDEVHISVLFTYDLERAYDLAEQWKHIAPVKIGGPAMDEPGGEFIVGRYIKPGYVMTSRGCPNNCKVNGIPFCSVPRREGGTIRELEIKEGNHILDDNLLACSDDHIKKVFAMLKKQKYGRAIFGGGLEAARLKDWHVEALRELKPKEMFFAYDTPQKYEPLVKAGKKLLRAGFTTASHVLRCYVLIGYQGDTFEKTEKRLIEAFKAGFIPMAMLYRDYEGKRDVKWMKFQRVWARPAIICSKMAI